MRSCRRLLLLCLLVSVFVLGQQTPAPTPVDLSRPSTPPADNNQSLADVARKLRSNKPARVQMSQEDAKELFRKVDETFTFASLDTGFPKRVNIKRQLIGQADVEKFARDRMAKMKMPERFERAELTMKKFGLLPRDFNLSEFLVKSSAQEIAGFYDEDTKSMSLLNWVPMEQQGPILAHELTHALQDQNYDLKHWADGSFLTSGKNQGRSQAGMDEVTLVRHAVVEGQAMVVYIDYLLAPYGRNLKNTPGVLANLEEPAVRAVVDTELMHSAPMVLREMGTFPYRDGLIFEAELLNKGGKAMAFAGVFARPPTTTHEVLQPRAYLEHQKLPPVTIPDMNALLAGKYEAYDSGSMGELDARALMEQFGERKGAPELAAEWQGGSYAVFRKADSAANTAPADLALLYVSHWKTQHTAEQFARIYAASVANRYKSATTAGAQPCTAGPCPVFSTQVNTEEGPVIVEQWPNNTVVVSESFDAATAAELRNAALNPAQGARADGSFQEELGSRFYELPAFRAFQLNLGNRMRQARETVSAASQPSFPAR
jgi:hypothetical protein